MKISLIWRNLIPAIIILGVLIFSVVRIRRAVPDNPPVAVAIKNADLKLYWNRQYNDGDATILKLKAGDSLLVLGYGKPTNHEAYYWVETADGQRGFVSPLAIDERAVIVKSKNEDTKKYIGDTVRVIRQEKDSETSYEVKTSDGTVLHAVRSEFRFLTDLELGYPELYTPMGPQYISKAKFEELCQTKTPAELENYFDKSMTVQRVDSGMRMFFNVSVLDTETGIKMRPDVSFTKADAAGVSLIQYKDSTDKNAFFLKTIPLTGAVVDIFHSFIDESYYRYDFDLNDLEGWKIFLSYVLIFVLGLFWLCGTCFLLGHIIMALIPLRYPFIWLGNHAVRWVVATLLIISIYIWTVLMLTWGAWWWAFLPVIAFMAISFEGRFMTKIMEQRCPQCKSMDSYVRVDITFVDEEYKWCTEHEYDMLVSSHTERWQTWTETVWKYGDGHTRTDKSNVKNHARTTEVHQYKDYKVLYLVKHYLDTYECKTCGAQYENHRYDPIEQDRELIGTHQETSVSGG